MNKFYSDTNTSDLSEKVIDKEREDKPQRFQLTDVPLLSRGHTFISDYPDDLSEHFRKQYLEQFPVDKTFDMFAGDSKMYAETAPCFSSSSETKAIKQLLRDGDFSAYGNLKLEPQKIQSKIVLNNLHPPHRAVKRKYFNYVDRISDEQSILVADIDRPFIEEEWMVGPVNLAVINQETLRYHIQVLLSTAVDHEYARKLERMMAAVLGGDPSFSGHRTKSPFFDPKGRERAEGEHFTHVWTMKPIDPKEFEGWLLLASQDEDVGVSYDIDVAYKGSALAEQNDGRNKELFTTVKDEMKGVYPFINKGDTYSQVLMLGEGYNHNFETPLPACELKTIAKSLTKWFLRENPDQLVFGRSPAQQSFCAKIRWSGHGDTHKEAAIRFDVSERTIRNWIKSGKLIKIDGLFVLSSSDLVVPVVADVSLVSDDLVPAIGIVSPDRHRVHKTTRDKRGNRTSSTETCI